MSRSARALPRSRRCWGGRSPSSRFQAARAVEREVGEYCIGARALEPEERFHHAGLAIDPASRARGLQHGVLAAHLVDEGRHFESLLHAPYDIEIGHTG